MTRARVMAPAGLASAGSMTRARVMAPAGSCTFPAAAGAGAVAGADAGGAGMTSPRLVVVTGLNAAAPPGNGSVSFRASVAPPTKSAPAARPKATAAAWPEPAVEVEMPGTAADVNALTAVVVFVDTTDTPEEAAPDMAARTGRAADLIVGNDVHRQVSCCIGQPSWRVLCS